MPTSSPNLDWQTRPDGELASAMKDCINALLASSPRMSIAAIAREVGLSGSFIAGLMNGGKAIRTRHMVGFNAGIERLEARAGLRAGRDVPVNTAKLVDLVVEIVALLPAASRADLGSRLMAMA